MFLDLQTYKGLVSFRVSSNFVSFWGFMIGELAIHMRWTWDLSWIVRSRLIRPINFGEKRNVHAWLSKNTSGVGGTPAERGSACAGYQWLPDRSGEGAGAETYRRVQDVIQGTCGARCDIDRLNRVCQTWFDHSMLKIPALIGTRKSSSIAPD